MFLYHNFFEILFLHEIMWLILNTTKDYRKRTAHKVRSKTLTLILFCCVTRIKVFIEEILKK